ncbi:unnamed protein product [Trichogramma brassicae]|uniref:Phospholipase B1, membrane-associated n=1 Tax=Trichogramma brassicae TaxID=86971 RepID=A0A6H5I8B2_9HYME|nr:unnamed protein product [Trichogramma brassicae]
MYHVQLCHLRKDFRNYSSSKIYNLVIEQRCTSLTPPTSVHRLRPGDIDVVGALGDSLVAGNGALEEFAIGTFIEARGVSWCAGGQDNWRKYLTVPNILKEFNPKLTGYATGTGEFISRKARLNIAFPVAAAEDALHQAKILVQRIRNDPEIDVQKHWKMITILFGANDVCSAQCYNPKKFSPIRYALHLRRTLDFLRASLPRTIVNLVPAVGTLSKYSTRYIQFFIEFRRTCTYFLYMMMIRLRRRDDIVASVGAQRHVQHTASPVLRLSASWQSAGPHRFEDVADVPASGRGSHCLWKVSRARSTFTHYERDRYDTSDDFTAVLQPFTKLFNSPKADPSRGLPIDANLVTHDCFHFSQKGHALGANLLWNNLLEPVGNKTDQGFPRIFERVLCPSAAAPYIFTNVNSRNFLLTGSQ